MKLLLILSTLVLTVFSGDTCWRCGGNGRNSCLHECDCEIQDGLFSNSACRNLCHQQNDLGTPGDGRGHTVCHRQYRRRCWCCNKCDDIAFNDDAKSIINNHEFNNIENELENIQNEVDNKNLFNFNINGYIIIGILSLICLVIIGINIVVCGLCKTNKKKGYGSIYDSESDEN